MKKLVRVINIFLIAAVLMCGGREAKANTHLYDGFYPDKKLPKEDKAVFAKYVDFIMPVFEKSVHPDMMIKLMDDLLAFNESLNGRRFESGRVFNKDSSFVLYAYTGYIRAYDAKKECGRVYEYINAFKEAAARDYVVVQPLFEEVYDPVIDKDVYAEKKKEDAVWTRGHILPFYESNCLNRVDYEAIVGPFAEKDRKSKISGKRLNIDEESEKYFHTWKLSKEDKVIFGKFVDLATAAFEKADPDESIKLIDQLVEYNKSLVGRKFASGKTFRENSSLLLYSYAGYIRAYDEKKDCDAVKEYVNRLKTSQDADYLIVDPLRMEIYDPEINAKSDVYKIVKSDNSRIIRELIPPFDESNCLTRLGYDSLIIGYDGPYIDYTRKQKYE